jgi:hypothetical protein
MPAPGYVFIAGGIGIAPFMSLILNMMLVAWGNDEALPDEVEFFTPEEFAEARTPELTRDEVLERRPNPWE